MNYGSVEDQAATEAKDEAFDEKNAYYLKETTLTREQKIRKCTAVAVPLLAAVLLVGGAALYLLRDFDLLYPGRGSGNSQEPSNYIPSKYDQHTVVSEEPDSSSSKSSTHSGPSSSSSEKKDPSDMASSCVAHEKCSGLVGECCPTLDGKFLLCCN